MIDTNELRENLLQRIRESNQPHEVLRTPELRALADGLRDLPPEERSGAGRALNELKQSLQAAVQERENELLDQAVVPIDVTAPMDVNSALPTLLSTERGTVHPISREIAVMSDILQRMGFTVYESREIDDQYHMFESLNFPAGHPARDDFDTFMTVETDKDGEPLIAPAHTSTMQNRIMRELAPQLERGLPVAAASIDRVFRNEDLDPRHEHTFYQHEGIFIDKDVHAGMLVATLKTFLESYYQTELNVRVNPFYFPFTEPSFEFSLSCPFCKGEGCNVCSQSGWIELLGCGMIHPNVLRMAGINPEVYTGFAWGGGVDRLVMMKRGVEDVRHFESAKLDFLRQF
ncbi:MAG: phenylalanine--tRNA ligase subunit alpha [Candidatus Nomurabacteria bacterium]|nr:MAG: phenylalanine--tRNA ligase subunit alpha [Candidatus Nomurabacteria bacterium]